MPDRSQWSREAVVITHTPDPSNIGITRAEIEREAAEWADAHGLLDYTIVICDELPMKASA